ERNAFGWLDHLTGSMLPFTSCEDPLFLQYSRLKKMDSDTFLQYAHLLVASVEEKISKELPDKGGIMFDHWTDSGNHYVGLFSVTPGSPLRLLTLSPLQNEEALDTESHVVFLEDTLEIYGKGRDFLQFIVGNNCNLMKSIANVFNVPLLGCASHRFNLAVQQLLDEKYPGIMVKLKELMKRLNRLKLKQWGKWRHKTKLSPVVYNDTRWSGKYAMVREYLQLKEFIDDMYPDLVDYLPSTQEQIVIQEMNEVMSKLESVTDALQGKVTMEEVRILFDSVIEEFPSTGGYLAAGAEIVPNVAFENALVKVTGKKEEMLTMEEKEILKPFKRASIQLTSEEEKELGFAAAILQQAKKRKLGESEYEDLTFIPPTCNQCERLFSQCYEITPRNLKMVMFLKLNRSMWNLEEVSQIVRRKKNDK
ncbi:hypothetical protein ROZALSC1DRAFT_30060, partial [Rozella allomycis CSF55]